MIDASTIVTNQRAQNILKQTDVDSIYKLYTDFVDVEGMVKIVSLDDVRKQDYTLSVNRYVKKTLEAAVPLDIAIAEFDNAIDFLKEKESEVQEAMKERGIF